MGVIGGLVFIACVACAATGRWWVRDRERRRVQASRSEAKRRAADPEMAAVADRYLERLRDEVCADLAHDGPLTLKR